jgi:hypothetical protein
MSSNKGERTPLREFLGLLWHGLSKKLLSKFKWLYMFESCFEGIVNPPTRNTGGSSLNWFFEVQEED